MTPTPITKKQFISWLVVFTIGMALWASPSDSGWGIAIGVLAFGNLVLMPSLERSRPLPAREVLWAFVFLSVFALLMIASKRWLPDDFGAPLVRAMRHPALVAFFWIVATWLTYRRYKVAKTHDTPAA